MVPTQALREPEWEAENFSRGGAAALFNYDVLGFDTRSRKAPSRYVSAYTEAGFNLGNWIVRSRQFYVSDNGKASTEHVHAYAQRDIAALKSTFQAGQIYSNNPVFGAIQLSGVQLFPDGQSRKPAGGNDVVVEGLAQGQSRIEVRQAGVLIHTTLVPDGPFRLAGLPLLNSTNDLDVSVIDVRGVKRSFVVSSASFRGGVAVTPGYHVSVGKVRERSIHNAAQSTVVMGSGTWGVVGNMSVGAGLLSSEAYQAVGGTLNRVFFDRVSVGVRHNQSRDGLDKLAGGRSTLFLSSPLFADIDMNLSATTQTRHYRELLEAGLSSRSGDAPSRFKNQYTAGLAWAEPTLGGFSLSLTHGSQFDGQSSEHLFASWNKTFSGADVALVADSRVGGSPARNRDVSGRRRREHALDEGVSLRLQVSIALGDERRINSYVTRRGDRLDAGTALSGRINESVNYDLGVERDLVDREQTVRAQVDALPRYTRVGLGVSRNPLGTSYTGQLQGGVVAHEHGLTFSPYAVQDTFGVLSVGDVGAARISTSQGPVWTDYRGYAVIAGLPAYTSSLVEVQTQSLPKRVDLKNGSKVLTAGRGSFSTVDFEVVKVRRLLLSVEDEQGRPLPQGAPVFGKGNAFVTSVAGEGMVFLNNVSGRQTLQVALPDSSTCLLHLNPEPESHDDTLYETARAVCRAR
ncbi:MAG: Outer membrane usher protein YraJ [Pseudomonas sp.]|nr:MAG: Outer membrane usher protein YraJ [Pseudomonas sp.]